MKTLFFSLAFVLAISASSHATENERFMQAMGETIAQMGQAKDVGTLQEAANKFERIANSETTEWLPNYYAALSYTLLAMRQQEASKIDLMLDKADTFIEKLEKQTTATADEVEVLKAQVAMMRVAVDGPARWAKYGAIFEAAIAKAKGINAQNPRAYALKAMMIFNTPVQFGGGADKACPEIEVATQKFANFKPASAIAPNWGVEQVEQMKKACK
jgi:hypothetical protein